MKKNDQGEFFVMLDECVACGCCEGVAPSSFKSPKNGDPSFVYAQPKTQDEMKRVFRAARICMVDCINYDGPDDILKEHFSNIFTCYERNGNICSLEHCPCYNNFIEAKSLSNSQ